MELIKQVLKEQGLRKKQKIDYEFTKESLAKLKIKRSKFLIILEKKYFKKYLLNAFALISNEICYMDPNTIASIVIFIVPHFPYDLKPISLLIALFLKLIE